MAIYDRKSITIVDPSRGDHDYYRLYTPSYQTKNFPGESPSTVKFAFVNGVLATTEIIDQPFILIDEVCYSVTKKQRSEHNKKIINYHLEEMNG